MTIKRKQLIGLIKEAVLGGNRDSIPEMIIAQAGDRQEQLIPHFSFLQTYFKSDELRQIFVDSIQQDYRALLNNPKEARLYFSDSELGDRLRDIHFQHPWDFYTHAEDFSYVFPSNELVKDIDDKFGMKLFLYYCFDAPLESFSEETQKLLRPHIDMTVVDAVVGPRRESGFACGGMEANYRTAIKEGVGYTVVNDVFLAKMFHRKGEAKKASLISNGNFKSKNNYVVWENVVYAPSNGCEGRIIEAIAQDKKDIHIDGLTIRPVRPIIGYSSNDFFEMFDRKG